MGNFLFSFILLDRGYYWKE